MKPTTDIQNLISRPMSRRGFLGTAGLMSLAAAAPALASVDPIPAERRLSMAARRGWIPNVPLVTHTGEKVNFYEDLVQGDRTILINFFVTACPDGRCFPVNQNLRKVQDMVGDRMGKDVFFYSVTLDSKLDTVERLKEYAEDVFEVGPGWLFLTGEQSNIDHLRRRQGFVDQDPERDRDVSNHSSTGRIIVDAKDRWAMVPLTTSPQNIYSVLRTM